MSCKVGGAAAALNKNVEHMGKGIFLRSHFIFVGFSVFKHVENDIFTEISDLGTQSWPPACLVSAVIKNNTLESVLGVSIYIL